MNLFTTTELIMMGSILLGILLVIVVLTLLELRRAKKHVMDTFDELVNDTSSESISNIIECEEEKVIIEPIKVIEELEVPLIMEIEEVKKEELIEEIEVLDLDEVTAFSATPVLESKPSINVIKVNDINLDIKEKAQLELQKMENKLETELCFEDTLTNLEVLDEENAIISYQELLSATSELKLNNILADDGDEPISINEVLMMFNEESDEGLTVTEFLDSVPLNELYNREIELSSISVLDSEINLNALQLENTANLEKLDKEIRKTNEILNILNEMKKNLD